MLHAFSIFLQIILPKIPEIGNLQSNHSSRSTDGSTLFGLYPMNNPMDTSILPDLTTQLGLAVQNSASENCLRIKSRFVTTFGYSRIKLMPHSGADSVGLFGIPVLSTPT